MFAGKQGFMTLRDLFRWADRYKCKEVKLDKKFYDWDQHMADHGKKLYLIFSCCLQIKNHSAFNRGIQYERNIIIRSIIKRMKCLIFGQITLFLLPTYPIPVVLLSEDRKLYIYYAFNREVLTT